jgi:SAM-dependent methyltransferase
MLNMGIFARLLVTTSKHRSETGDFLIVTGIILKYVDKWYEQPLGAAFAKAQQSEIEAVLPHFSGQWLLQLGINPGVDLPAISPIPHSISLAPDPALKQSEPFVVGSYHALPFLSDSIDSILMNQALEFETDISLVLEEVWRILAPYGQVAIMGFNSLSSWGLIRLLKKKRDHIPWQGNFHTLFEVKWSLLNLNFTILSAKTFFFRPPCQSAYLLNHLQFLEVCGASLLPTLGAGYLIVAQKKVFGATPLHSRWQFSELLLDRAIKPTVRNI